MIRMKIVAPKLLQKEKAKLQKILLENANLYDVPIYEDPNLVELLGQLDLNEAIPEDLYQAVAEVFAFIYRLDEQHSILKSDKLLNFIRTF